MHDAIPCQGAVESALESFPLATQGRAPIKIAFRLLARPVVLACARTPVLPRRLCSSLPLPSPAMDDMDTDDLAMLAHSPEHSSDSASSADEDAAVAAPLATTSRSTLENHVVPPFWACYLLRSKRNGKFSKFTYVGST